MTPQCIVVGAGVGGLSAAIYARLQGWDVLVLEQGQQPGGKAASIDLDGYRFDPGPSIVILTELYEELFKAAGRNIADYLQFERLDPFTRVSFQGRKPIDLPSNEDDCLKLLKEIAPEDHDAMKKLLASLDRAVPAVFDGVFKAPIDQPWQMASLPFLRFARHAPVFTPYKKVVDKMFRSPLLKAFFYGFPSYGGQSYHSPSPGSLLIPYFMIKQGVFWPKGGIGQIPQAFYKLATELGVEFQFGRTVTDLPRVISGKRVRGVQLSSGELIEAHAVISNRDRFSVAPWLGREVSSPPSYSYFTVHLGLKKKLPSVLHHTLLIPKDYLEGFEQLYQERAFPARPIVYLNETTGVEPEDAPPGCSNLFAVVTSPAKESHLDWVTLESTAKERVLRELEAHLIEIDPEDIAVERIQTPTYFETAHGNYRGSLYGLEEAQRLWGFMPHRCRDEQIDNLFYAGGSVQPGAGLPMVTLSGKFAASYLSSVR